MRCPTLLGLNCIGQIVSAASIYLRLRRTGRITLFFTNGNYDTVDFELTSIQNNLLSCLPDFQFNGNGPLVAESTAELKIVNRDVIIDRLDPKYISNQNQPTCRIEIKTDSHLQLKCPSVAHLRSGFQCFLEPKL